METLNILVGVLLLLSAIVGAWLTRQNKRQQDEIERLNGEVFDIETKSRTESDRRYWQGYYDADLEWQNKPLYQMGLRAGEAVGRAKMLIDQAGVACEMEELRKSGELEQTVKGL